MTAAPNSSLLRVTSAAKGYEGWAPLYDAGENPLLAREERYLSPLLGDVRKKKVLDLACGTGRWLEILATRGPGSYAGIDSSAAMLEVARRKDLLRGWLVRGACESLPFASCLFDLAICSFALGHFEDIEEFAAEVSRVAKSGADIFITDLHPSAYEHGWRVGFRDENAVAVEIETLPRRADEVARAFLSQGMKPMKSDSLWLEAPEQPIFERAGKADRFASASGIPAIAFFHFQRAK